MVLDLGARIKAINSQHGYQTPEPMKAEEADAIAETQMTEALATVEYVDDTVTSAKIDNQPESIERPEPAEQEVRNYAELVAQVAELTAEIKKMNKHINSIQKFIKKGN